MEKIFAIIGKKQDDKYIFLDPETLKFDNQYLAHYTEVTLENKDKILEILKENNVFFELERKPIDVIDMIDSAIKDNVETESLYLKAIVFKKVGNSLYHLSRTGKWLTDEPAEMVQFNATNWVVFRKKLLEADSLDMSLHVDEAVDFIINNFAS